MTDITLDWDISFDTVKSSRMFGRCRDYAKEHGFTMKIRRSASGNTHVKLTPPSFTEYPLFGRLMIRAYLGDDAFRIANDLKRHYTGGHTDVLFTEKYMTVPWKQAQLKRINREILAAGHEYVRIFTLEPGKYTVGEWEEVVSSELP